MMMTRTRTIKVIVMNGGDGQNLPEESNLKSKCRPGVDQVETRQGVGPTWAHPAWSPLGLHLVHNKSTNLIPTATADHHPPSPSPSP